MKLRFNMQTKMEGWVRLRVCNKYTDECRVDTGWFKNLITNQGLNAVAQQSNFMAWYHVGTSSTPPAVTDTWLGGFVASINQTQATVKACAGAGPYYGYKQITRRFPAGVATGNLSEIGVGWSSSTGTLFSRALIKDGGGNPTTITVLADEYLDFTYELRYYAPVNDVTGQVTIDGILYDYTVRALDVTNPFWWADDIGTQFTAKTNYSSYHEAYTGGVNAVTASTPLGTNSTGTTSVSAGLYSADTHFLDFTVSASVGQWNVSGGLAKGFVFGGKGCRFQAQFTKVSDGTGIPKNGSQSLNIYWRISWARA